MQLSDFNYNLPPEYIATEPLEQRSASKLLVLPKSGDITHGVFSDLTQYLKPNDCLIFNNTKVMPARMYGNKETGGKLELLIERVADKQTVYAHIKANKALKPDTVILIGNEPTFVVSSKQDSLYTLKNISNQSVHTIMANFGELPLPPYMKRAANQDDSSRYQTVYAQHIGAVAAPTAGLHFDEKLLSEVQAMGVSLGEVTLHVGAGTFLPVKVDDISKHKMHSEWIQVGPEVVELIKQTKKNGGRVFAVGTTTLRSLETAALTGELRPYQGETDIFIKPGATFNVVDNLITNFHLPESTLLMLVAAFSGYERIMNAYQEAIQEKYRFFSYGDAMLLCR